MKGYQRPTPFGRLVMYAWRRIDEEDKWHTGMKVIGSRRLLADWMQEFVDARAGSTELKATESGYILGRDGPTAAELLDAKRQ